MLRKREISKLLIFLKFYKFNIKTNRFHETIEIQI